MLTKATATTSRLYLRGIEAALQRGNATEHTYRSSLKTLVETLFPGLTATNEPRRSEFGAPDYLISQGTALVVYIEAKDVGELLDKTAKTPQLKRYREGLVNLVLTDYLEFSWFEANELKETAYLARLGPGSKLTIEPRDDQAVFDLLERFMDSTSPTIRSPHELAERMAKLAQLIRAATAQVLKTEGLSGSLPDQLESFKQVLLPGLTSKQVADIYAQTICYGLFAARFNPKGAQPFDQQVVARDPPRTNPFLQKTFYLITDPDLDERIDWAVDEVANLLNRVDIAAILQDFGRRTHQDDPVVHSHEIFLAEYDPKMREARGVYYPTQPVVSYIMRSVDHLLKTAFGLPDGLADRSKITRKSPDGQTTFETHQVLILDPATGIGTFLSSVIANIYEQTYWDEPALWSGYVSQQILARKLWWYYYRKCDRNSRGPGLIELLQELDEYRDEDEDAISSIQSEQIKIELICKPIFDLYQLENPTSFSLPHPWMDYKTVCEVIQAVYFVAVLQHIIASFYQKDLETEGSYSSTTYTNRYLEANATYALI